MIDENSEHLARLIHRMSDVESLLTMMQRTLEELDEVIVKQGKRIDLLDRKLTVLASQLGSLAEPESRRLEDDRPPHY